MALVCLHAIFRFLLVLRFIFLFWHNISVPFFTFWKGFGSLLKSCMVLLLLSSKLLSVYLCLHLRLVCATVSLWLNFYFPVLQVILSVWAGSCIGHRAIITDRAADFVFCSDWTDSSSTPLCGCCDWPKWRDDQEDSE